MCFDFLHYFCLKSYVYWTMRHCDGWRMKGQLDVTCYFISLLMCSTCFGRQYIHHRELATILLNYHIGRVMMDILMLETCWAHKKWNKIASDIKLVFYSSTILSEIFLIFRRTRRHVIVTVHSSSCKPLIILVYRFWWNSNFLYRFSKNTHIKFHVNHFSGSRGVPCRRTDGQTDKTKLTVAWRNFEQSADGYCSISCVIQTGEGRNSGGGVNICPSATLSKFKQEKKNRACSYITISSKIWYDIFVIYSWAVTRWQQYSTHLHTNSTQNNTMKQNIWNRTYIRIRIHKRKNKNT